MGQPGPVPGLCTNWLGRERVVQPPRARFCLSSWGNDGSVLLTALVGETTEVRYERALCKPYLLSVGQLLVVSSGPGKNILERMWDPGSVTYGPWLFGGFRTKC